MSTQIDIDKLTTNLPSLNKKILTENVYLTESPKPVIFKLPEKYYILPKELIFKILESHQRYLVIKTKDKIIYAPVVNHFNENQAKEIGKLNTKVVNARLDDGLFYFKIDLKKDIKTLRDNLKFITFHPQAGTYFDKVKRLQKIFKKITKLLNLPSNSTKLIQEFLKIIKNDKATLTGREFPELEGYILAALAKKQGYDKKLINLSKDYIKDIPETLEGKIIALLDLFDSVMAIVATSGSPTATQDPYQIRQKLYKIINLASFLDIDLKQVIKVISEVVKDNLASNITFPTYLDWTHQAITQRLYSKIKNTINLDEHIAKALSFSDTINVKQTTELAKQFKKLKKEEADRIYDATKRVFNILLKKGIVSPKGETRTSLHINPSNFKENEEKELYDFVLSKDIKTVEIQILKQLSEILERFFDKVLVIAKDKKIRENRLALLLETYRFLSKIFKYAQQ